MFHCCCSDDFRESRTKNRKGPEKALKLEEPKGQDVILPSKPRKIVKSHIISLKEEQRKIEIENKN